MTILELFKKVDPSVLAAKMIFKHLQDIFPVLKIADIADTSSGGTPNRGMIEYYNGDIPWVKSGELKDGLITNCDEYITESGLKNSSAKLFPKGTLLVAMYGANIGKTGILDFDATTNQAVCAIFPKVEISKDFLFWYFKQQRIDFIALGKGGAQPNISQTVINNASIVVPDVKTQKLIVDFLERIEKGNGIDEKFFIPEVLKDVEQIYKYKNSYVDLTNGFENQLTQLENLNQAILQEAVQGKLLSEPRFIGLNDEQDSEQIKNHRNHINLKNHSSDTGHELLKRIKSEKAKSGKKEKPLPPIKPEEIPFEIPENWVWCRLGEITTLITDGKHGDCENEPNSGYYFLSAKDVKNGKLVYVGSRQITYKDFLETHRRTNLEPGDLCIVNTGATIGKTALAQENELTRKTTFQKSVAVIKVLNQYIEMKYIENLLIYETPKLIRTSSGSAINNLLLGDMRNIIVPLPPLSEQTRIVAEIEKQLAKTKQLKEHIIANQHATEQLLKALLHGAFEVEESPDPVGKV